MIKKKIITIFSIKIKKTKTHTLTSKHGYEYHSVE